MNLWNETKSIPISRPMVWEAYKKVRSNQGSAGVDQISMEEFDAQRSKHLHKIWNRMASGSYFPPPVKEVEIPKKDGKIRKLGIPTIGDRVDQMVVKEYIEPRFEQIFSPHSYGYRPHRNAHQALESVRSNCKKTDWVIDLDIKGFFDNIDHGKLLMAIEKHVSEKWCILYIQRWLQMPVQTKSGELVHKQGKGTPQGGVISPLLANLFLHYAMDRYSFQPRSTMSKRTGKLFLGFDCAISISSKKRIADKMKDLDIVHLTHNSIVGVAVYLEPFIRGWINYYGRFRLTALKPIFQLLRKRLVMWARKRYKRYKTNLNKAYLWLKRVKEQFPNLFYQWKLGFS
jgi:retron-type reverse transcriptase